MKSRFEVVVIEDRGPKLRRRYFLAFHFPEAPEEEGDAVEELLYDVAVTAIPADFDFPDATHHGGTKTDGVWVEADGDLKIGDLVDLELKVVGRVTHG